MSQAKQSCPSCNSTQLVWKQKAQVWECAACEERFAALGSSLPARRLDGQAVRPENIFFSYGHDSNRELVELFVTCLEQRGHKVWIDWKEIGVWDDWKGRITRGIDASELTIAFISNHAMRDPGVCRNEIAIAMNRFGSIHLVLLEEEAATQIPVIATDRQWADLSNWRDIREGKVAGVEWERWYEERLINLIERLEGEATTFADETQALRQVLSPASFDSRITQHIPSFIGRQWVFDAYRSWLDNPDSRVFWIKAGPGVGKSAIAANLAARERSAIVANWFCDAKSAELRDPHHALRSLAFQLALRWEDYRVRLLRQLQISANATSEMLQEARKQLGTLNTQDLFSLLLTEPLNGLIWREHKLVIVVDALDEATDENGHNRIAELIGLELDRLPNWLAFVVTSRPEVSVITRLQCFKPFEIDAQGQHNLDDLRAWYESNLSKLPVMAALSSTRQDALEKLLLDRSEGMILFLKMVQEGLREGSLTIDGLDKLQAGLPGLFSRYYASFAQRFGIRYETDIKPLVRLLVAAAGPLPEDLACAVLHWNREQYLAARNQLGSYVVDSPAGLALFHKTLHEWLTSTDSAAFFVDPAPARQALADVFLAELDDKDSHAVRWRELIRVWLPQWIKQLQQGQSAQALTALGRKLHDWGDYREAEYLLREALDLWRAALPSGHPVIAHSLNSLAGVLDATGRYTEAGPLYREALELWRAALPHGHPDIAIGVNSLASVLNVAGHYAEAEPLYRETLEIWRAALPPDHPYIAMGLNNLASVLGATGRYAEAEPLYREALELRRAALPPGHPDIAISLNNLALLLEATGHYAEAEPVCREALELRRAVLPSGHPDIASSLNNLASVLQKTGHFAKVAPLVREALDIWRAALPAGHPIIATGLNNLASVLTATKRYAEAEPLYREALDLQRVALPPGHPDIATSLDNLAGLLKATGRYAEAEPLYREALELRRAALPPGHPDIATSLSNLATLLYATGRYAEAEPLYREALVS